MKRTILGAASLASLGLGAAVVDSARTVANVFADNARRLAGQPAPPLERNPISRRTIGGWKPSGSQAEIGTGNREAARRLRQAERKAAKAAKSES